jgi:F-type H+-transporting ATPase subunit delta
MQGMEEKMSKHFQREVRLVNKIDLNLLGGVQLVVHDHIFDGSIKGKLDQLRYETLNRKQKRGS